MRGCYVFVLVDDSGVEVFVKRELEEIQDYAIDFLNEQYDAGITDVTGMKRFLDRKPDLVLKIFFLNPETFDMIEEEL